MTAPLEACLAGPFLRTTSSDELVIWLATSIPVTPRTVAEVWEPLSIAGQLLDDPGLTAVGVSNDVTSIPVAERLYVSTIRVRPFRRLRAGALYAYRVVLNSELELGDATRAVLRPPARLDRVTVQTATSARPIATFVMPRPTASWWYGVPVGDPALVASAAEHLAAAARPGPRSTQPNPAPTQLCGFGAPFTYDAAMPAAVLEAIRALALELGTIFVARAAALHAAAYLLAWSPGLWRRFVDAAAHPRLTAAVDGNALLMAHTPTYLLGADAFDRELVGRADGTAGRIADALVALTSGQHIAALFAHWGNTARVSYAELVRATLGFGLAGTSRFVVAGPPAVGVAEAGEPPGAALAPRALPDRIATAVTGAPMLLGPDGSPQPPPAEARGHEISIVVSATPGRAFIAESGAKLGSQPIATHSLRGDSTLRGKVFEVAASRGSAVPATTIDPALGIDRLADTDQPRFASVRRTASQLLLALEPRARGEAPITATLPAHGRLFVVTSPRDGLHLGNRLWSRATSPELARADRDPAFLRGIEVRLRRDGDPTVLAQATADADGWVDLATSQDDGAYVLELAGPETAPHAGPDTPVRTTGGAFKDRVWLAHRFAATIVDGRLATIDREPVPAASYRLLIDPVWMHSVRAIARQNRTVDTIVIHRTDDGGPNADDASGDASAWQRPGNTGAHYLLARDGTMVKTADESESIGHAGFDARTSWRGHQALNATTVGIEIASLETWGGYTAAQYASLIRTLRRYRTTTRTDVRVPPHHIIGHSDLRLQDPPPNQPLLNPPRLGGRNDPGLAFDWTKLERRYLGLRRQLAEAAALYGEWPTPPATGEAQLAVNASDLATRTAYQFHRVQVRNTATPAWEAERRDAIDRRFLQYYPAGTTQAAVDAQLQADLTAIGYLGGNAPVVASAALKAFRSHVLAGPRRTYFATKRVTEDPQQGPYIWSTEEERDVTRGDDEWKLAAVWAHEMRAYVEAARRTADPNDAAYDQEAGWRLAHLTEAGDDPPTLP